MASNIGALWIKKRAGKSDFLSGEIDLGILGRVRILAFRNEDKEGNEPDYQIILPKKSRKDEEVTRRFDFKEEQDQEVPW